jgi:choice-of-anchor C domain-containing protein
MTRSTKLLAGAAFLSLLGAALPAQAAIVVDGNFDNPPVLNPFLTQVGGITFGGPTGTAWTILGNSVDEIGSYWQNPTAGGGSVDLNGGDAGGISQAVTLGGGTYQLSFYLSGNPDGGDPLKSLAVSIGDLSNQIFTFTTGTNSHADMQYVLESVTFHAGAGTNVLSFLSQDAGTSYGAVIGGISISAIPEPATWTMLILGLGGIGMMLRKNRVRASVLAA